MIVLQIVRTEIKHKIKLMLMNLGFVFWNTLYWAGLVWVKSSIFIGPLGVFKALITVVIWVWYIFQETPGICPGTQAIKLNPVEQRRGENVVFDWFLVENLPCTVPPWSPPDIKPDCSVPPVTVTSMVVLVILLTEWCRDQVMCWLGQVSLGCSWPVRNRSRGQQVDTDSSLG